MHWNTAKATELYRNVDSFNHLIFHTFPTGENSRLLETFYILKIVKIVDVIPTSATH